MPTPRKGYHTKDGAKVPSVTTVLSRFKESGGLISWAWKMGKEGKDYRSVRDDKASSGTLAHDMIERFLRGMSKPEPDAAIPEEIWHEAEVAFSAFECWLKESKIVVRSAEEPLVSEVHGFGGTPDFEYDPSGLGDFKTSKRIYPETIIQLGAYKILWEENGKGAIVEGRIARFDKETGLWEEKKLTQADLEAGERAFLLLLAAYRAVQDVERRAK